jgi:hypothetical protein
MRLLITCEFSNGSQVLIMDPATDADFEALTRAQAGDPDAVLSVPARITKRGPVHDRLIRAGAIRSVTRDYGTT